MLGQVVGNSALKLAALVLFMGLHELAMAGKAAVYYLRSCP